MIGWLTEALVASTVLMLLVLLVRRPVARLFGARAAYALWLLPALRMIMPPIPQLTNSTPLPAMVNTAVLARLPALPVPPSGGVNWLLLLGAFWAFGAMLSLTLFLFAYRRLADRVHRGGYVTGEAAGIPIIVSPLVDGPLAIGLWRRAIVLPADHQARYSPAELDLALRHEAAHHHGFDLVANAAALLIRAVHWFNPVAIFAHRAFAADQEMACDARVLALGSATERCDYLQALLKTACALPVPGISAMRAGQLKERLRMIGRRQVTRRSRLAGGAIVGLLTIAGLAVTASGSATAREVAETASTHAAPILALGGVTIDPVAADEPDGDIASDRQDHPASRRKAHAGAAKTAADEASKDADEAVADAHAAAAEALAEADGAVAAAGEAQAEASDAGATASHLRTRCDEGVRRTYAAASRAIVICVPDGAEIRRSVLANLRATRAQLARDMESIDVRGDVLKSLDETIARMEKSGI